MSVKSSTGTAYGTPTAKGGPARSTEGRRCGSPGCSTILSVYNTATMCYLHATTSPRPPLAGSR